MERTNIQDGSNLPQGKPQISSILYLATDQSGGPPGPFSGVLRRYAAHGFVSLKNVVLSHGLLPTSVLPERRLKRIQRPSRRPPMTLACTASSFLPGTTSRQTHLVEARCRLPDDADSASRGDGRFVVSSALYFRHARTLIALREAHKNLHHLLRLTCVAWPGTSLRELLGGKTSHLLPLVMEP